MTEQEEIEYRNTLMIVSTHLMSGLIEAGLKGDVPHKVMAEDAVLAAKALIAEVAKQS